MGTEPHMARRPSLFRFTDNPIGVFLGPWDGQREAGVWVVDLIERDCPDQRQIALGRLPLVRAAEIVSLRSWLRTGDS